MRRRLGVGIAVALLATACGSPAPPSASVAPSASPDIRHDELDQAEAVWEAKGPTSLAYTTTASAGGATTSVHLTEMDGRIEALVLESGAVPPDDGGHALSIDGVFETAHEALDASGAATYEVDQLYGYLPRVEYTADRPDGSFTVEVRDLVTPADRTAAGAARDALNALLQRWASPASPAWEYTWTRFGADDTDATQTAYTVRHGGGQTTLAASDGGAGGQVPGEATIEGTVEAAVSALTSGAWVDVAVDPLGYDTLIAVDPSPSATGDAWWIRIDHTDRFAERARQDLDAARTRWTAAGLERYSYRWAWDGSDGAWSWGVRLRDGTARLNPGSGAPAVEDTFVAPRIEELFGLVDRVLAAGGSVDIAYDKALGYPTRVEFTPATELAPRGVVTITKLRER
jgi:hypothetical protein